MRKHRITYMSDGAGCAGRLSLSPAGESDTQARVRADETREGLARAFRVVRVSRERDARPETVATSLLGPTGAGKLGKRGPRDAGDRAAKVADAARERSAELGDAFTTLRAHPARVAARVPDAPGETARERKQRRDLARAIAHRAAKVAKAPDTVPVAGAWEGPIQAPNARETDGACVPAWGAEAFTRGRKVAR